MLLRLEKGHKIVLPYNSFFEKKIYFHKTNLKKKHTYNTKHTIYKRKEIKVKKRLEILKEGRKKKWGVAII